MEKQEYIKPEIVKIPCCPMTPIAAGSMGTDMSLSKEHDTFFKEDEEDDELWSDFVPFEEEE